MSLTIRRQKINKKEDLERPFQLIKKQINSILTE